MELLVAAANDQSGESLRLIVVLLLGVASGLTLLTVWYWRFTDPRRHHLGSGDSLRTEAGEVISGDVPEFDHGLGVDSGDGSVSDVTSAVAVTGQLPLSVAVRHAVGAGPETEVEPEAGDGDDLAMQAPVEAVEVNDRPTLRLPAISIPDANTGEDVGRADAIDLTDEQWDDLATAVLSYIGWDASSPSTPVDEATPGAGELDQLDDSDESLVESDSSQSVGAVE